MNLNLMFLVLSFIICVSCQQQAKEYSTTKIDQGPYVGHADHQQVVVWARVTNPGKYQLHLSGIEPEKIFAGEANSTNDLCLRWTVDGLQPASHYRYFLSDEAGRLLDSADFQLITEPSPETKRVLEIAWVSCADQDYSSNFPFWDDVAEKDPDLLVLLGDTPYVDSTDLGYQFQRYREFNVVSQYARLIQNTPFYGTWDDHDFGLNDTDGNLPGKENARQAFMAYRPNPTFGEGQEGIYTSFRKGPVEVFLLDTRWFAGTEPSPVQPDSTTLLGKKQWEWLLQGLRRSTADFKILASGIIWNGSVRPNKPDHWGEYAYERDSLFRFIGVQKIGGVILVGGDIHRSRLVKHQTEAMAGYPIYEIISSPMHTGVIESANVDHPGLLFDMGLSGAYVITRIDNQAGPSTMDIRFLTSDGKLHYQFKLSAEDLQPKKPV